MKSYLKILFLSLIISATFICAVGCGGEIDVPDESKDAETEATDEATDESDQDESGSAECKHVYEGEKVLLAATCTKEGILKKTCTTCGKSISENIPKTAHTEVEDKGKAATCTESGISDGKHCSVCNTVTVEQKPIAALGHKEVIVKGIEATCTAAGISDGSYCDVCKVTLIRQEATNPIPHTIIKRTNTPVTCVQDGKVENFCTVCKSVIGELKTIEKGHFKEGHEHTKIDGLCTPSKEGKCDICKNFLIAPGTYTVIGFGEWEGSVQFKFDYYNNLGVKQSASKITHYIDDHFYWTLKFDDYVVAEWTDENGYETKYDPVITIIEENFAVVDENFYTLFQKKFEKGEYTLSGKYEFREDAFALGFGLSDDSLLGVHNIKFKYLNANGNEYYSDYIQILATSNGPQMNYSNRGNVAYFSQSDEWGGFDENLQRYVIFEAPQTVSKEFFEWFTFVADKVIT